VKLPTKFDGVFLKQAPEFPIAFSRSIGWQESRLNPLADRGDPADKHVGLMQVGAENWTDYNDRHGTSWDRSDMFTAARNVAVWNDSMKSNARVLARFGFRLPLTPDRVEFARLLVATWNSGSGAVSTVLEYLERNDLPLTHANVYQYAQRAAPAGDWRPGTTWKKRYAFLFDRSAGHDKYTWQRNVVSLYREQSKVREAPAGDDTEDESPAGSG
jgi:hypothetical protein